MGTLDLLKMVYYLINKFTASFDTCTVLACDHTVGTMSIRFVSTENLTRTNGLVRDCDVCISQPSYSHSLCMRPSGNDCGDIKGDPRDIFTYLYYLKQHPQPFRGNGIVSRYISENARSQIY